jgi:hypothetical protein
MLTAIDSCDGSVKAAVSERRKVLRLLEVEKVQHPPPRQKKLGKKFHSIKVGRASACTALHGGSDAA